MAKLKEIRIEKRLTQNAVAEMVKVSVPMISAYENETALPDLEDAFALEKELGVIEWKETYTPKKKHEIVQALIELTERYPLEMVSEFAARMFRRNTNPESFILHYAKLITPQSGGPLYMPEARCKQCED